MNDHSIKLSIRGAHAPIKSWTLFKMMWKSAASWTFREMEDKEVIWEVILLRSQRGIPFVFVILKKYFMVAVEDSNRPLPKPRARSHVTLFLIFWVCDFVLTSLFPKVSCKKLLHLPCNT